MTQSKTPKSMPLARCTNEADRVSLGQHLLLWHRIGSRWGQHWPPTPRKPPKTLVGSNRYSLLEYYGYKDRLRCLISGFSSDFKVQNCVAATSCEQRGGRAHHTHHQGYTQQQTHTQCLQAEVKIKSVESSQNQREGHMALHPVWQPGS